MVICITQILTRDMDQVLVVECYNINMGHVESYNINMGHGPGAAGWGLLAHSQGAADVAGNVPGH